MPAVTLPEQFRIDDSAVLPPAPADEADAVEVLRGPNIQPFPQSRPFADTLTAELVLKVGDNITTDHIMPAGAKILPYRSNIPKLAEFCFTVCDPTYIGAPIGRQMPDFADKEATLIPIKTK